MSAVEQGLRAEVERLKAELAAATSVSTPSGSGETKTAAPAAPTDPAANPEEVKLRMEIDECAKAISTLKSKGAPSTEWLPMVDTLKKLRSEYETKIG